VWHGVADTPLALFLNATQRRTKACEALKSVTIVWLF
jgi:hypothetical protein